MRRRLPRCHTTARKTTFLTHVYDSGAEAAVATILHTLCRAGRIASWEPHPPPFILLPRVPGQRKTKTRPFLPTLYEEIGRAHV